MTTETQVELDPTSAQLRGLSAPTVDESLAPQGNRRTPCRLPIPAERAVITKQRRFAMKTIRAAAVQLSPAICSRGKVTSAGDSQMKIFVFMRRTFLTLAVCAAISVGGVTL